MPRSRIWRRISSPEMRRAMINRQDSADSRNNYWISFADLMSALLIIFILICIALLYRLLLLRSDFSHNIDQLTHNISARTEMLKEIRDGLAQKSIKVELTDNDTVLRIPDSIFNFETGSYEIDSEKRKQAARDIGEALKEALTKNNRYEDYETVFIEGHTDSRKATNYRLDNWELSALRAISLWQFWLDETDFGNELQNLRNKDGKHLFSVSGYAATRRAQQNEVEPEDYQKNRRIDIRFIARQPALDELMEAGKPLGEKPAGAEN